MPDRNGDWIEWTSADDAAPHRTASRKASSRAGGSNPVGSGELLVDAGARLQLPDDLKLLPEGVVLDGSEGDKVLGRLGGLQWAGRQGTGLDLGDDVAALPHIDKLALLRESGRRYRHWFLALASRQRVQHHGECNRAEGRPQGASQSLCVQGPSRSCGGSCKRGARPPAV